MKNHPPRLSSRLSLPGLLMLALSHFIGILQPLDAVQAPSGLQVFTQPDGTQFEGRLHGDAYFNWYDTADGQPIVYDYTKKWWTYATKAAEGVGPSTGLRVGIDLPPAEAWKPQIPKAELKARNARTYRQSVPTRNNARGNRDGGAPVNANVAMFLTTFSDRAGDPKYQPADFQNIFFSTADTTALTAANLYKQMSYGQHLVTAGPSGIQSWATAPNTHWYYGTGGEDSTGRENSATVAELVRWRVQNADAGFNFGPYDTDNDEVVDLVCIVYQGTAQTGGQPQDIWPIRSNLFGTAGSVTSEYTTSDKNAEGNFVKVSDYIVIPELTPGSTKPITTIGLFCHEYGHGIGWPDLYDRDGANPNSTGGLGNWCLMSGGNWNITVDAEGKPLGAQGSSPCWANPMLRMQCGWVTPQVPTVNQRGLSIPDAKDQNVALLLWDSVGSLQYFMVENRQRKGFDQGLPGAGLLIWHVDDNMANNNNPWWFGITGTTSNTSQGHQSIALEQADGLFQIDRAGASSGDTGDPFVKGRSFSSTSVPSSRAYNFPLSTTGEGRITAVALQSISDAAPVMTADVFVNADSQFPDPTITGPEDGQSYFVVTTFQGTASDNVGVASVHVGLQRTKPTGDEWFNWIANAWETGGFDISKHQKQAGGTTSWQTTITAGYMTEGSYLIFARAVDTNGADSGWEWNRFQVVPDPNGPAIAFDIPTANQNFASGAAPNFQGTVANVSGSVVEEIALKMEEGDFPLRFFDWTTNAFSPAGSFVAANVYKDSGTAPWVVNMTGRTLPNGRYTLFAKVINGDLRESGWRAQAFRVGLPLEVAVTNPGHQASMQNLRYINGTYREPSGTGAQGGGVRFTLTDPSGKYWNGSTWVVAETFLVAPLSSGGWSYDSLPAAWTDGLYHISAGLTTNAGEPAAQIGGVNQIDFRVDTGPPEGAIISPAHNTVLNQGSLPVFSGTLSDGGGIGYVNCYVRRNRDQAYWNGSAWTREESVSPAANVEPFPAPSVAVLTGSFDANAGTWVCNAPLPVPRQSMENGSYNFIVIIGDRAGNYLQRDAAITLDHHQVFTWTGATLRDTNPNNNSHSWGHPENWSPFGEPGSEDIAVLGIAELVETSISRTVYKIRLEGGQLRFTNGPGVNGTLTATQESTWSAGNFTGQWEIPANVTLTVQGGYEDKRLGADSRPAVINNAGTIRFVTSAPNTEVARITGWNSGGGNPTLNNMPSGVIEIEGNGTPFRHIQYTGMTFVNEGRIVKTAGTGTTQFDSYWVLDHKNGAVIENAVAEGILQFSNVVPVTFQSGSIMRGPGTIRLAAGTVNAPAGSWNVEGAGTLLVDGSVIAGPQTGSLTLVPSADAALRWLSGTLHGNYTIPAGALLTVEGNYDNKNLGADGKPSVLTNEGIIRFLVTGGNSEVAKIKGWNSGGGNPTINNMDHARFEIAGPGSPLSSVQYTGMVFNNRGRIVKTASPGTTSWNTYWDLRNEAGALVENTRAGSVFEFTSGTATFKNGSVFYGPGTIRFGGTAVITAESGLWQRPGDVTLLFDGMTLVCPQTGALTLPFHANAPLRWRSGIIHGNLTIPQNVLLTVEGGFDDKNLGADSKPGVLTNQGTIRSIVSAPNTEVARIKGWNSGGGNPTINNHASGVFEIEGDGVPLTHTQYTAMTFNNEGRVVKTAGIGTLLWNSYWTLDNATGGIIESAVGAGSIQFAAVVPTMLRNGTILRGPGTIRLAGGLIDAPAGIWSVDTSAALVLAGATLQAPQTGSLTLTPNTGTLKWLSGTIHGNLTIPSGATLEVDGDYENKPLGADGKPAILDNFGTIRFLVASGKNEVARIRGWNSGGGNPTINNKPSGLLSIEGNGPPLGSYQYTAMPLKNEGRIVKTTGGGTSDLGGYWSLDNATGGILECQDAAGTIQFVPVVPMTFQSGTILRGPGKFRHAAGGLVGPAGTWTIEGGGEFLLDGGTLVLPKTGSVAIAAVGGTALRWISGIIHGNLTIPSGSTLSIEGAPDNKKLGADSSPAVLTNAGTMRFLPATAGSGVARITGWNSGGGNPTITNETTGVVRIEGDGTPLTSYQYTAMALNNAGRIVKTAGTGSAVIGSYWALNNSGTLGAEEGMLDLNTPGGFNNGTRIENSGVGQCRLTGDVVTLRGTTIAAGRFVQTGGTLTGHADGTGVIEGATYEWSGGAIGGTVRFGTTASVLLSGAASKDLAAAAVLNNAGTVTWTGAGAWRGMGNSRFNNLAGGVLNAQSTGGLTNSGGGNRIDNAGSLNIGTSPGILNTSWAFTQTATGSLNIEVAGPAAAQFDRLAITGAATLGGTVSVTKLNGYNPAVGTTFAFLTAGSVTGTFANVGGGFAADYTPTGATLRSAPFTGLTFDSWAAAAGLTGANAALAANPDGDLRNNWAEYVFNSDPNASSPDAEVLAVVPIGDQQWLTLSYRRWADREAAGVTYTPEVTSDLVTWANVGITDEIDTSAPVIPGSTAYRARVPLTSPLQQLHIRATKP